MIVRKQNGLWDNVPDYRESDYASMFDATEAGVRVQIEASRKRNDAPFAVILDGHGTRFHFATESVSAAESLAAEFRATGRINGIHIPGRG
jgi:hypothetical protein